jgi:hypothetical protein
MKARIRRVSRGKALVVSADEPIDESEARCRRSRRKGESERGDRREGGLAAHPTSSTGSEAPLGREPGSVRSTVGAPAATDVRGERQFVFDRTFA